MIVIIAAIVLWWGYGKYADIRLQHDNAVLQQQKLINEAQAKANAAALEQQQKDDAIRIKDEQDRQIEAAKLQQQNAALVQANTALAAALTKAQKQDATLPPTELAARWQQLVPAAPPASVTVAPTGMTVNAAAAVATVQELEKVPVLTAELANEKTTEANTETMLASSNQAIGFLNQSITDRDKRIDGLNLTIVGNAKQCTDEKNVMKSEFRKSKRRWFIIGYVAGDKLTFQLYGTKDGRTSAIDGPHQLTETPPGETKYIEDPTKPLGYKQQVETPHPGGSAVATYTVTYPDGHTAKQVFRSYYRPWPAQYIVNTGTATPSPTP